MGAASKLVSSAPGRHPRDAEPGAGCIPHGRSVVDAQRGRHFSDDWLPIRVQKCPEIKRTDDQAGVLGQIVWRLRPSVLPEVLGRRDQDAPIRREAPRDERGVAELGVADRHVECAFDHTVRDAKIEREVGVADAEIRQARYDVHARERCRSRDPERAARRGLLASQNRPSGMGRVENVLDMRQERKTVHRQRRLARRSME